jgi:very-short-patch-repair endonuclease
MTPPELRLWLALRGKARGGFRFRRQCPVGPYVLDFYCPKASLAVEIDGESHGLGDQPVRDERRDAWIAARGIRTLRFQALDARDNLDGVVRTIEAVLGGEA